MQMPLSQACVKSELSLFLCVCVTFVSEKSRLLSENKQSWCCFFFLWILGKFLSFLTLRNSLWWISRRRSEELLLLWCRVSCRSALHSARVCQRQRVFQQSTRFMQKEPLLQSNPVQTRPVGEGSTRSCECASLCKKCRCGESRWRDSGLDLSG